MPVPLRIAYDNLISSASLSASSSVGTLAVNRLLSEDIQDIWRAGSTTAWLLADLGSAQTIGGMALVNSNAIPADTVRFRVSSSDATGAAGDVYDSGVIAADIDAGKRLLTHFISTAVSGRYVRIDLVQSEAPSAGVWFAGPVWTPTRNVAYGWERLARDWSSGTLTRGLNLIRDRRARQGGYAFVLRGLMKSEVDGEIEDLNLGKGTSADILVCVDVDEAATKSAWGPLGATIRRPQLAHNFYVADFTIWNRL